MMDSKSKRKSSIAILSLWRHFLLIRRGAPVAVLLVIGVALAAFAGHRIASYKANHTAWLLSPISSVERSCPDPDYPVLQEKVSKGKICITTLTDSLRNDAMQRTVRWRNFNNILELTWPNKQAYVEKHGYYLYNESEILDNSRPPAWSKILAVKRLLTEESCNWVFWMDADTVIMDSEKRIEEFLPEEIGKDLVLTIDRNDVFRHNSGAWLIRNTPWSLQFLDHWWSKEEFVRAKGLGISGDNHALKSCIGEMVLDETFFDRIVVPERCTFNSEVEFVSRRKAARMMSTNRNAKVKPSFLKYHKGDFVAHIAGTSNKKSTIIALLNEAH